MLYLVLESHQEKLLKQNNSNGSFNLTRAINFNT